MVTILSLGFTAESGTEQERCTSPLMCTEQAPHCATPQPYLVPVRPTCSRITHNSGVSGSACTSRTLPLMLSFAMRSLAKDFFRAVAIRRSPRVLTEGCKRQRPRLVRSLTHAKGVSYASLEWVKITHVPAKAALDLIGGGHRFADKNMRQGQ